MKENFNIDGIFREELEHFSATPPTGVWDRLESDLDKKKKTPVIPLYMKVAGVAALIAAVTGIGFILRNNNELTNTPMVAEEYSTPSGNDDNIQQTEEAAVISIAKEESRTIFSETTDDPSRVSGANAEGTSARESAASTPTVLPVSSDLAPIYSEENSKIASSELSPVNSLDAALPAPAPSEFEINNRQVKTISENDLILQQNIMALEAEKEAEAATANERSWSLGTEGGPQYTYRDVEYQPFSNSPATNYDVQEEGIVAFAGGVNFEIKQSKRWAFQSGVYYSKMGMESTVYNTSSSPNITSIGTFSFNMPGAEVQDRNDEYFYSNTDGGAKLNPAVEVNSNSLIELPDRYDIEQNLEFIEIPFIVNYLLIDRKVDINLSGGVWTNFLVGNSITATGGSSYKHSGSPDNIREINYAGSVGLGFDYPFTQHLLINVEPLFKYYLSPVNLNSGNETRPYSMGVMTGVRYTF